MNFDELMQFVKDSVEIIVDKSAELYKSAEEKTKKVARTTKLQTEIAVEKTTLRRLYREIGEKYYNLHKDDPEEALATLCSDVTATLDRIDEKQEEIDRLKEELCPSDDEEDDDDYDFVVEIFTEEADVEEEPEADESGVFEETAVDAEAEEAGEDSDDDEDE
ncbi:MAG TPA: hypothetical protein GXZ77_00985 [Papillibacter sp.]|nr:hypothetical protein [Papillibacter sp.]